MKNLIIALCLACSNAFALNITAQSWLEADYDGNLVDGYNITEVRSIASITKLMTVMAVIDSGPNMQEKIGKFTREQLIQLAMVKSDNNAAKALCDNFPGGKHECVRYMNFKAFSLGMFRTKFVEPTGLSPMNVSTALDLLTLVFEASNYADIVKASQTRVLSIKAGKTTLRFNNTNPIVGKHFIVSKTGTTNAAGSCIVMMMDTDVGRRVIILLGSKSGKRIPEATYIASNTYR